MTANGERFRVPRAMRTSLALVVLLLLLPLATSQAAASTGQWRVPGPTTKLYIGQAARLTAQIPATWTVTATSTYDYSGPSGFVYSRALSATSLTEACAIVTEEILAPSATTSTHTTYDNAPACLITSTAAPSFGIETSTAVVVPHPYPFTSMDQHYGYALLMADPAHFPAILASVSFAPDRVTPYTYVQSVIDIIEGRSLYSDEMNWSEERELAASLVTDWDLAHSFVIALVLDMRARGDMHSQVWSPETISSKVLRQTGFGMYVVGTSVLQVNPDGPAAHAGIVAGDQIVTVDGDAIFGPGAPQDLGVRFPNADSLTLTFRHRQTGKESTVTLQRGTYDHYLPPTGRRLDDNIGYVELFTTLGQESPAEYAKTAQDVIARIDRTPTCGWVVDMRSNGGGSVSPMVQGLAPIIGNGRVYGYVVPDGPEQWFTLREGAIYYKGIEAYPRVTSAATYTLKEPNPPVAVLTGPYGGSAAEVTVMAFIGREGTRLFGSPTAGLTTANQGFQLFDGSWLLLATAWEMDRTGHVYKGESIKPDQQILTSAQTWGTDQDAVINTAANWLAQQPECRAMNAQASHTGAVMLAPD